MPALPERRFTRFECLDEKVLLCFFLDFALQKAQQPPVTTARGFARRAGFWLFEKQRLTSRPSPITFRCSHPRVGRDIAVPPHQAFPADDGLAIADPDGGALPSA
ncbi:hypothetical protein FZC33_25410 [Labrys sp. KNU-23]|uniref:hypothetical protein n=1 Tax=Labrys sp. KNU-23 TaxID=2789216 RepID=UPI0011EEFD84|nr:hypothetical protein [Labrys sp. KNU-23]QEN89443.1 hypothetical protein FZC33_25410 [Labrys sp. KNU-23]